MTFNPNPYQSSDAPSAEAVVPVAVSSRARMLWLVAYLYPVFLLAAIYGTWLFAWAALGHIPRPYRDDPKGIDGIVQVVYFVAIILCWVWPLLTPLGFCSVFFLPCGQKRSWRIAIRFILALLYVAISFLTLLLSRVDPGGVLKWYWD